MDRPIALHAPGRFEIYCHHSPVQHYPEEAHATVQVCVPLEGAVYAAARHTDTGRAVRERLGARDVLVIPAGQPHAIDWQRAADIVSLQVSERFIAEELPQLRLRDAVVVRDPFLSASAERLRAAVTEEGGLSIAFAEAIVTAMLHGIAHSAAAERGAPASRRVAQLSDRQSAELDRFIDDHLERAITLDQLAAQLRMSKWHFMRRFYARYGSSPHDVIVQRRLARAKDLLHTSATPIAGVALAVGMHPSHFSRAFRKCCGVSPREFRLAVGARSRRYATRSA